MAKKSTKKYFWEDIGKDYNSPFIRNYIWTKSFSFYASLLKVPQPSFAVASQKDAIEYISNLPSWVKTHEGLKSRALRSAGFISGLIDKSISLGEALNNWTEINIQKADLKKASNRKLAGLLNQFIPKQAVMYTYGTSIALLDFRGFSFVEGNLMKYLRQNVSEADFERYYSIFTEPSYNSFSLDQDISLLKLMSEFYSAAWAKQIRAMSLVEISRNHKKFYARLKSHAKNYGWVYYVYAGPAFREEDFLNFIKDYLNRGINPKAKLRQIAQKNKKAATLKKAYIKKFNPDKFNRMILDLAGKMVWGKPRRKDYQSKSYFHLERLLQEIANRLYISLSQARCIPPGLLLNYLEKGAPDLNLLNEIYNAHVCLPQKNGAVKTLRGAEASLFIKKNIKRIEQHSKYVKKLTGATAFPGKVRGTVRIVNNPSQIHKMNYGDILISEATSPSIVLAMKQAAAIVTDEGGLTCHASIVSRELGIPCIIGTKAATKIFKDGDRVEVDATRAVIQKL